MNNAYRKYIHLTFSLTLRGYLRLNDNIMKIKKNKIVKFEDHLDKEYGKRGTAKREKYEQGFESFKLGAMLQELRDAK